MNGFLEVHQQTLIMVTRADAEKQAAQLKVENLERDVTSCQAHINTLKDELTAACQRHWSDDEDVHRISIAHNVRAYKMMKIFLVKWGSGLVC